jgi:hypothetical protein
MLNKIMKLVEDTHNVYVYANVTGGIHPIAVMRGREDFYSSLRLGLELLLNENEIVPPNFDEDISKRKENYERILNTYFNVKFDENGKSNNAYVMFPIGTDKEVILNWLIDESKEDKEIK